MNVVKRDGTVEQVKFDKISSRIRKLTYALNEDYVDYFQVAQKVISGLYDGVTSTELDKLSAETAASMITTHPDYGKLAARITITSLYKDVAKEFSTVAKELYEYINPVNDEPAGLISDEVYAIIEKNATALNAMIVHDRDFNFDYFGYKTLEKSYLLQRHGKPAETPQQMYMRVSVGIWRDNLEMVQKTYDLLSQGLFTHATPTLFNSGTKRPQMSSCFLLDIDDDSIPGIYKTLSDCAKISQSAGGIGVNIHKIRAKGSYIKGTNGWSNGIVPMLRVFNETARYVDQGGGKRKGSIAVYLEPWHGDVFDFIDLRKNHGKEEMRARDLFLALWIPDLFMKRVEEDGNWTLFSPEAVPGLIDAYDTPETKAFTELYEKYESEGKGLKTVKARELWEKVLTSQIETGTPYMLYKDAANYKSNQKNLGTIKSSNLCTEILEFTDKNEIAVCNLASIALPRYVVIPTGKVREKDKKLRKFDFQKLYEVTYQATVNLNQVIDVNFYPTEETQNSNFKHRPIGLGVQGLADTFAMLGIAFESDEARKLIRNTFTPIKVSDFAFKTMKDNSRTRDGSDISRVVRRITNDIYRGLRKTPIFENPNTLFEVGTEEAIRKFTPDELDKLLEELSHFEFFENIKYAVVQSGVGLDLGKRVNTGNFDLDRLKDFIRVCKRWGKLSKEHNGDYLSSKEYKDRFDLGLDSINIAPQFGQLETLCYLDEMGDDILFGDESPFPPDVLGDDSLFAGYTDPWDTDEDTFAARAGCDCDDCRCRNADAKIKPERMSVGNIMDMLYKTRKAPQDYRMD